MQGIDYASITSRKIRVTYTLSSRLHAHAYAAVALTAGDSTYPVTRFEQSVLPTDVALLHPKPAYSDAVSTTDVLITYDGLALFEQQFLSDTIVFNGATAYSDTTIPTDANAKTLVIPNWADSAIPADSAVAYPQPAYSDTTTPTDDKYFVFGRISADTATPGDTFSRVVDFIRGPSDTATATEAQVFGAAVVYADTVTPSELAAMGFARPASDSVASSDASVLSFGKVAADTVGISESIVFLLEGGRVINAGAINSAMIN